MQTTTPLSLLTLPSKDALIKEFVGKNVNSLRTPALIVDKSILKNNCERVTKETERRGMGFRAHVKSESTNWWAYV
jgi:D-serine deaminase-like pyridoxal phosphate-dependent protein